MSTERVPLISRDDLTAMVTSLTETVSHAALKRLASNLSLSNSGTHRKLALRLLFYFIRERNRRNSAEEQRNAFLQPAMKARSRRPPVTSLCSQLFNGVDVFDKRLTDLDDLNSNLEWVFVAYVNVLKLLLINSRLAGQHICGDDKMRLVEYMRITCKIWQGIRD